MKIPPKKSIFAANPPPRVGPPNHRDINLISMVGDIAPNCDVKPITVAISRSEKLIEISARNVCVQARIGERVLSQIFRN